MMKAIQRFGGALFTPAMLFAFAGVVVGLGTLFTTESIMGPIAAADTTWTKFWTVILDGGWTVFNQLPLLFAVALPIGLAKKQAGRCCLEAFVSYLTFNYFVSSMLSSWAPELGVDFSATAGSAEGIATIAGIRTLDMGIAGALLVSGVVIALHNRFFDTRLPEWLGVFSGSTFVYMIAFLVMLPLAGVVVLVWPKVQVGMHVFQQVILNAGSAGVGIFVFLERVLIPFGLHHLLYAPFYYDNVIVQGGIYAAWANALPDLAASTRPLAELAPWASLTATGWSKLFGIPGIAAAFYATAKPERRKRLLALLVPVTLTSVLCGVDRAHRVHLPLCGSAALCGACSTCRLPFYDHERIWRGGCLLGWSHRDVLARLCAPLGNAWSDLPCGAGNRSVFHGHLLSGVSFPHPAL
jgi:PTS system arbutin-like IIC component